MSIFVSLVLALAAPDGFPAAPPAPIITPSPFIRAEPLERPPGIEPNKPPELLNTQEIFNDGTYPFWAKAQDEEGNVRVVMDVDASGAVRSCRVVQSSGSPNLDLGTCDIMSGRARFAPARDRKGQAVASTYVRTVNWVLQNRGLSEIRDHSFKVHYSVDSNLQVTDCRIEQDPVDEFDPRSCAELRGAAQMLVVTSPADFNWKQWRVVLEMAEFAGAADKAMMVGKREGEMAFDRVVTRVTVNPQGRITHCQTLEEGLYAFREKKGWCERAMTTAEFVPASDPADRQLTSVAAIYLRRK
jgi:TonB family protein